MKKARVSLGTFLGIVLLFSLFGAWGILHVWTRNLAIDLGYKLSAQQALNEKLLSENKALKLEISTLKNSSRLESIAKNILGLHAPSPDQVVYVWLDE